MWQGNFWRQSWQNASCGCSCSDGWRWQSVCIIGREKRRCEWHYLIGIGLLFKRLLELSSYDLDSCLLEWCNRAAEFDVSELSISNWTNDRWGHQIPTWADLCTNIHTRCYEGRCCGGGEFLSDSGFSGRRDYFDRLFSRSARCLNGLTRGCGYLWCDVGGRCGNEPRCNERCRFEVCDCITDFRKLLNEILIALLGWLCFGLGLDCLLGELLNAVRGLGLVALARRRFRRRRLVRRLGRFWRQSNVNQICSNVGQVCCAANKCWCIGENSWCDSAAVALQRFRRELVAFSVFLRVLSCANVTSNELRRRG